ncbi:hypothetical protein ACFFX1_52535 [Dactylosporangium sucinum]|uniref:hypothetical protein n=1 Tax=Dactylosporangium sucinum TaxID=1424081 RepID=UPI00167E192C|nr:hypothetical protein [Dactylosporangium sucinum]
MGIADLLQRFRPAGPPGAARPAAVPADPAAEAAAELLPVFAALRETTAEAAAIRATAETGADTRRRRAVIAARRVVAGARRAAPAARAQAFAEARAGDSRAGDALMAAARHDADEVRRRATERLDRAVSDVVAGVLAELYDPREVPR